MFGQECLTYLLKNFEFSHVLDIGSGAGMHAQQFVAAGKRVTAIDYGKSHYFHSQGPESKVQTVVGDFNSLPLPVNFYDCVWACHVLEHQVNPGMFLRKVRALVRESGVVAITVPPLKHSIVGGHVSLWNAGLLLYHLVLAGFDCSDAHIKSYGYNISVIVSGRRHAGDELESIVYDSGDIGRLARYFPPGLTEGFDGNIRELNWR